MSKQTINIGASPNDGTGTPLRTSFDYTNQNFTELYTAVGPSGNNIVVPGNATITGDLTVDTSTLKVDSTNNRVGIGTASPANTLEVVAPAGDNIVSTFRSGDATAANNAGGGFRSISSATAASRVAQIWLDADGANFSGGDYFFIQKNGSSGTVEFNQSSNAAMTFLTNSTERMRIDSSGNVGIGVTPAGTGGCLQLKSGITFPATQVASSDANTLDDYEEGTWVGTLKGATTDPTIAVTATGRYTKVGRLVSVQISFSNVNTTGASGDAYIIGLPFANSSITTHGSAASYLALTFSGYLGSEADPGGTNISLFDIRSGNVWASAQHSAGTSRYINAELTYTVA